MKSYRTPGGESSTDPLPRDLCGYRFGQLTVLAADGRSPWGSLWRCRCACGRERTVLRGNLIRGHTQTCGRHRHRVLTGLRFGRLVVSGPPVIDDARGQRAYWPCRCDCGETSLIRADGLTSGAVVSCGCRAAETRREWAARVRDGAFIVPEHDRGSLSYHRLYRIWRHMMGRCYTPTEPGYAAYGGRGIAVFIPWHDFLVFYADNISAYTDHVAHHGEVNTTLDRYDADGDYGPLNCRWTTLAIQSANKRVRAGGTSRFRGVSREGRLRRYRAQIALGGHHRHLGYYDSQEEAAAVYRRAAEAVLPGAIGPAGWEAADHDR